MASVLAVSQRERVGGKRSAALRRGLSACTAARRAATLWGKWELGGDEGHTGCVNRLRWSRSGGLLASVSDDLRLLLWRVDQVRRPSVVCDVETEHGLNAFGVAFVPGHDDSLLVTGAMSKDVRMHRLRESGAVTTFLGQHDNRVKCVDVAPDESDVAFSGGEDGRVCVWDVREGHRRPAQVMVDLWNGDDFKAQSVRHMAVNPLDGKIVAVAATDSLVRLYDRRMTSADGHTAREDASCVAMYAPVQKCQGEDSETITHVTWDPRGASIAAHYNPASSVVVYDVRGGGVPASDVTTTTCLLPQAPSPLLRDDKAVCRSCDARSGSAFAGRRRQHTWHHRPHSIVKPDRRAAACRPVDGTTAAAGLRSWIPRVNELVHYAEGLADDANAVKIQAYSAALRYQGRSSRAAAPLLVRRAKAKASRGDNLDLSSAAADYGDALELDPDNREALAGLVSVLHRCGDAGGSDEAAKDFVRRFPEHKAEVDVAARGRVERGGGVDIDGLDGGRVDARPEQTVWRSIAMPLTAPSVYSGHLNLQTDIKEAAFYGDNGEVILAGSDEGRLWAWDRASGEILACIYGDDDVVNAVQPHPSAPMVATSGIDSVVRLWEPRDGGSEAVADDADDPCMPRMRRGFDITVTAVDGSGQPRNVRSLLERWTPYPSRFIRALMGGL